MDSLDKLKKARNTFYFNYGFAIKNTADPATWTIGFPSMVHNIKANNALISVEQVGYEGDPRLFLAYEQPSFLKHSAGFQIVTSIPSANCFSGQVVAVKLVDAGSFEIGRRYQTSVLGDTNWEAIGGISVVDVNFTATGAGSGTGKAWQADTNTGEPVTVTYNENINFDHKSIYGVSSDNIVNAYNMIIGEEYKIVTQGSSDFTTAGAADNDVGTTFRATKPIGGTGTVEESTTENRIGAYTYTNKNPNKGTLCINPFGNKYTLSLYDIDRLSGGRWAQKMSDFYYTGMRTFRVTLKVELIEEEIVR